MTKKIIIGVFILILVILAVGAFSGNKASVNNKETNINQPAEQANNETTNDSARDSLDISPSQAHSLGSGDTMTLDQLPDAPSGYSWYHCKGFNSYVLKPTGWYTKDETKEDTEACFITKEQIVSGGMFQTGMSINAVPNIPKKTGATPSAYAKSFFDAAKSKMDVENYNVATQGPLKVHSATLYPPATGNNEAIVLYQIVAANDTTGSIFVITVESPESEWKTFMPMATTMTQNLALNGDF